MTDSKGQTIAIGDRVLYLHDKRPAIGTVRKFCNRNPRKPCVKVDNGDPLNPDHKTNGWSRAAWVECKKLEVVK
jgi:hypothetical protein